MSKSAFTPGPWTARVYGTWPQWKVRAHKLPRGGQWRTVATIGSPRTYPNPELEAENTANAHLIEAAPELYRAAEYFEWCADVNGDGTASHCAVCEAHQIDGHGADCWLGNALSKARGEP